MPYDLDRIRPERAPPPLRINWPVCLLLLVLLMCAGSALLLFRASALLPKQALPFWAAVLGPPFLLWLIGFSWYVGRKQEIRDEISDTNVQSQLQRQLAIAEASQPLHVLAMDYRLDAATAPMLAQAIAERRQQLLPKLRHTDDGISCQASWLEVPGQAWWPDGGEEFARQLAVTAWLFTELLGSIKTRLQALQVLPEIRLHAATQLGITDLSDLWQQAWYRHFGAAPHGELSIQADPLPLTSVESWLEQPTTFPVTLVLAVQLYPLLDQLPANGQSEAAMVMLLSDQASSQQLKLTPLAMLHRPEQRAIPQLDHGLRHVLCWGGCPADTIQHQWLTAGATSPAQQALLQVLTTHAVGVSNTAGLSGQHDIDAAIGTTGLAAEWLAVCLATEHAGQTGTPQLISTEQAGQITLAVITPAPIPSSLPESAT